LEPQWARLAERVRGVTAAVRALSYKRVMLDGEAVTHCLEGLPDFHKLSAV